MPARSQPRQPPTSIGVLIVDDHDAYRAVAVDVVNAAPGFEVIGLAVDRSAALECLAARPDEVDLVLMDVNLGADDGVELSGEIAKDPDHPDIVLVSALALQDLPRRVVLCGARGYLPKSQLSPSALKELFDGVYDWSDDNAPGGPG